MLGIASSVTDSTATAGTRILASRQTVGGLGQDMAAAVDGERPRAPEAPHKPEGDQRADRPRQCSVLHADLCVCSAKR
jgi:hypothetical protein